MPNNESQKERQKSQASYLRMLGSTYREIGQQLEITTGKAFKLVKENLLDLQKKRLDDIELYREQELSFIDYMQRSIVEEIGSGNLKAIDRGIRLHERRCKLLGLEQEQIKLETSQQITNHNVDYTQLSLEELEQVFDKEIRGKRE